MSGLVIVGTGGFAREAHEALEARGEAARFLGFLDDAPNAPRQVHDAPVLGSTAWATNHREVDVVVAIGKPAVRRRVVQRLVEQGVTRFGRIIDPRANIGRRVSVGEGSIVLAGASVTTDARIGRHVVVNPLATIAHDCTLDDFVLVAPGAKVSGNVRVATGADLGTNATILQGLTIGAWSIVGAGATVLQDVPPDTTVVGVPAKVIRQRPPGWHEAEASAR